MKRLALPLALFFLGAAFVAAAMEPSERLADPALESRARTLSKGLRCLVCQNQSIDDSDAPLARDLRRVVRERLTFGDSDEAVSAYVVERYGDYVLLTPPVRESTALLWAAPVLFLAFGALGARAYWRRRASSGASASLSAEERKKLKTLLSDREET